MFQILEDYPPLSSLLFYMAKRKTLKETKNLYPAPLAALKVIKKTYKLRDLQKALKIERNCFSDLACQQKSKNLIRVFSLIRNAKKEKIPLKELNIKNTAVLGAGTMGSSIAYVFSDKGFPTRLMDVSEKALSKAMIKIKTLREKQLKKHPDLFYETKKKMNLLSPSLDYQGFASLDMVIEAVPEDLKIKKQTLQKVSPFLNEKVIFASNTSSLSLKEMASGYPWPHRFLGMHFFNPVYKMPLVEIVKTYILEKAVLDTAVEFVKKIGKIPIIVQDSPGFVVNRLLAFYFCEALWFLKEGKSIAQVDQYFSKGFWLAYGAFSFNG